MMGIAFAMGGAGQGGGGGGFQGIAGLLPLIILFAIFYFILIRPQQKRAKQHKEMLASLRKGDEVITSGGIHGKITGITDNVVTLEVADNVRIKVSKEQIAGLKRG